MKRQYSSKQMEPIIAQNGDPGRLYLEFYRTKNKIILPMWRNVVSNNLYFFFSFHKKYFDISQAEYVSDACDGSVFVAGSRSFLVTLTEQETIVTEQECINTEEMAVEVAILQGLKSDNYYVSLYDTEVKGKAHLLWHIQEEGSDEEFNIPAFPSFNKDAYDESQFELEQMFVGDKIQSENFFYELKENEETGFFIEKIPIFLSYETIKKEEKLNLVPTLYEKAPAYNEVAQSIGARMPTKDGEMVFYKNSFYRISSTSAKKILNKVSYLLTEEDAYSLVKWLGGGPKYTLMHQKARLKSGTVIPLWCYRDDVTKKIFLFSVFGSNFDTEDVVKLEPVSANDFFIDRLVIIKSRLNEKGLPYWQSQSPYFENCEN